MKKSEGVIVRAVKKGFVSVEKVGEQPVVVSAEELGYVVDRFGSMANYTPRPPIEARVCLVADRADEARFA